MKMHISKSTLKWMGLAGVALAVLVGGVSWSNWGPDSLAWGQRTLATLTGRTPAAAQPAETAQTHAHDHTAHDHTAHDHAAHDHAAHDHAAHDHAAHADEGHAADAHDDAAHTHAAHDDSTSLTLSREAKQNLGLTADMLRPIALANYRRSITVPAVIVPKPGRSSIVVSSPLNGIVTHVHAVTGEAVLPGELLFEVRLTYEDLVESQTTYLKTISELQVEDREIARLEEATRSGAISGKLLLERRYAKEKLEAFAKAQREALRMHGLSERQVDAIGTDGKLLRELQVLAPDVDSHDEDEELHLSSLPAHTIAFQHTELPSAAAAGQAPREQPPNEQPSSTQPLVIDDLLVHKGQAITAGERLCTLSDYSQLFIEGKAFEADMVALSQAIERNWPIDALLSGSSGQEQVSNLKLAFISNAIDPLSRTLSLFVELPNQIVRDEVNQQRQRHIYWKYRVGQRLELKIPVEEWQDQIVLPIEAIVKEGADWYVFQQNAGHFDRVPVHVRYRDQTSAVISADGAIRVGSIVARTSAHQMQMALKNKSGGGVDPHAGHSH